MSLFVSEGGEYRGERYIFCDAHPTVGRNNGQGCGEIFEGDTIDELRAFLDRHAGCHDDSA